MKEQERKILQQMNDSINLDLVEMQYEYCRFDAFSDHYIVEIKNRGKYYKSTLIEFDKYTFNKEYAKIENKYFLYAVGYSPKIYIFNITDLDNNGYNYRWHWREMPRQTEFGDTGKIYKFVGYVDVEQNARVIDT